MLYNSSLAKSLEVAPLLPASYQQVTGKLNLCPTRYIPRTPPFHYISHRFHKSLYLRSLYHGLVTSLTTNLTTNLTTSMATSLYPSLFLCLSPTSICNGRTYQITSELHFSSRQFLPYQHLIYVISCIFTKFGIAEELDLGLAFEEWYVFVYATLTVGT